MRKFILLSFLAFTLHAWAAKDVAVVSLYSQKFAGKRTASGEKYDQRKHTAAHRTLPFGTCVELKNRRTGKQTRVVINDRGPHIKGRTFDISDAAAQDLGVRGVASLSYGVVPKENCRETGPDATKTLAGGASLQP